MVLLIWAFGRSYLYPVSILECAFILTMMFLPERIFSPYSSFLWHITLRSEDYRKMWRRKGNLQIAAICIGAFLGSFVTCMDRNLAEFPHWVIESAIVTSLIANSISFW